MDIVPLQEWLPQAGRPLVVAGPCSVESEGQVLATVRDLKAQTGVHLLRGGIWKPRSRPGTFPGIGEEGLTWLKAAGEEVGLPVITEVANAQHVEACLKHNIDMVWIGARTTVNPFSVQEIADALQGVDIPVFVKNPVNPDLQLWIGALERFNRVGIRRLVAIHRGFSSIGDKTYRNAPNWQIPIELKTLIPSLPVLCDPSHIGGKRHLLAEVAQKALDLDMDGLMVEAHIDPENAKSDAAQQITPKALGELLNALTVRTPDTGDVIFTNRLQEFRNLIDEIDASLLKMLAERMRIVEKIGEYKLDNDVTILQLERWREILRTRTALGLELGLDEEFINEMLNQVHKASITLQTQVMNQQESPSATSLS